MVRSFLPLLASALAFLITACQEREKTTETNSDSPELAPQSEGLIPVAVDIEEPEHYLAAGQLIKPDHPAAEGRTCVAFVLPTHRQARAAWVWLEGKSPGWRKLGIFRTGYDLKAVIGALPEDPGLPVVDLESPREIPDELSFIKVAEWADEAGLNTASGEEDPDELSLQKQYSALAAELNQLGIKTPRNRPPEDPNKARAFQRLRNEKSMGLSRKLQELRKEAIDLGISLPEPKQRLVKPTRRARITKIPVSAISSGRESENGLLIMSGKDVPRCGALSGVLLARSSFEGLEVLSVEQLAGLCTPPPEPYTGFFTLPEGNAGSGYPLRLCVQADVGGSAFGLSGLRLAVARQGELPDVLAEAPSYEMEDVPQFNQNIVELRLFLERDLTDMVDPPVPVPLGEPLEAITEIRYQGSEAWIRQRPFPFALNEESPREITPVLTKSPNIAWGPPRGRPFPGNPRIVPASPQEKPNTQGEPEPGKLATKPILGTLPTGGGKQLLIEVSEPPRLRLLDLHSEKWVSEFSLPESDGLAIAADAKRVFLYDPASRFLTSYLLPDFKKVASVEIPAGFDPRLLAAGYDAESGLLGLLSDQKIELRDAVTLEPSGIVIRANLEDSHGTWSENLPAHLGSFQWKSWGKVHRRYFFCSPHGDHFLAKLDFTTSEGDQEELCFDLRNDMETWRLDHSAPGLPHLHGRKYFQGAAAGLLHNNPDRPDLRPSPDFLLPSFGAGLLAVTKTHNPDVYPPGGLSIQYLARLSSEEALFSLQTGQSATEGLRHDDLELGLGRRLYFLPDHHKLVAISPNGISFEQSEGSGLPALAGPADIAIRGKRWEYKVQTPEGKIVPLKLESGPNGAIVDAPGILTWDVPGNFPKRWAEFQIALGDPPVSQTVRPSIAGVPDANLSDVKGDKTTPVSTNSILSFPGRIDQIIPSYSQEIAAVISNSGHRITIVDLTTNRAVASYDCPTGAASYALTSDKVIVWHHKGGQLETRSLPDLKPIKDVSVDEPTPLTGISAGSGSGALPPLAFFSRRPGDVPQARLIDPDTLELGPAISLPRDVRRDYREKKDPYVPMLSTSADGKTFLIGESAVRRGDKKKFLTLKYRGLSSYDANLTTDGKTALNIYRIAPVESNKSETVEIDDPNDRRRRRVMLWPDRDQSFLVATKQYEGPEKDGKEDEHIRIYLLDPNTREQLYTLEHLFEWDEFVEDLFEDDSGRSKLFFASKPGVLLTVSWDRMRLVMRRISL